MVELGVVGAGEITLVKASVEDFSDQPRVDRDDGPDEAVCILKTCIRLTDHGHRLEREMLV